MRPDPRQAAMIADMRRDSVLDRGVPLGWMPPARGEHGAFDDLRRGIGFRRS